MHKTLSNFRRILRGIPVGFLFVLLCYGPVAWAAGTNINRDFQERLVTGRVVSADDGLGFPGVNIIVKGTSIGAVSDSDGKYSINVPTSEAVLVFSAIGFKTQEVTVGARSTIDVTMNTDVMELAELVVVGYGTMKKSDLTGAVARVTLEDMAPQANINVVQALQGNTPGVNVQTVGGAGSEPNLSVRGQTSLSASDQPLIVLNGVIFNGSLNDINSNDVETIDILKDASAAAVYGARSANGVLLITTKKGKSEKPKISYSTYYGVQDMTNNPMKVMDAEQYAIRLVDYYYQQDLYKWYKTAPTSETGKPVYPNITDRTLVAARLRTQEEKDNYIAGKSVDWVKQVTRVAPLQQHNINFSGQSNTTSYYVSGSYTKENGILLNDAFKRLTFNANVETKLTDWLTVGMVSSYSYRDYSGLEASLSAARTASPLATNKIGLPTYDTYLTGELYMPYPLANLYADNSDKRNNFNILGTATVTVPMVKGLSFKLDFSNDYNNRGNFTFYPLQHPTGAPVLGSARKEHNDTRNLLFNGITSYVRSFGDHNFNATLLYTREQRAGNYSYLRSDKFDNPVLGYNSMELGTQMSMNTDAWQEQNLGYMGRLVYSYKNRYMLTGTVRKDGFSGFGRDNKTATFPSLSLGWVLSEEQFFSPENVYLKLRASYGLNGNQGIGRYSSYSRMATSPYAFGQTTYIGVYPSTLGNSSLSWESTASLNLGIDYGFMNDRITGSIELYQAETSDVLVQRAIPISTGFTNVWTNIGGITNKGFEVSIKSVNVQKADVKWTSAFSFSLNRDKISKLYGGENDKDIGNSWFVGQSISALYDYEMSGGLWTEAELYNKQTPANWYPGQIKYNDLNNDGVIEPTNDRKVIGYRNPSYRFGINNMLTYKNFTLSFFINSVQGGKKYYMEDNSSVVNISWNSDDVYRINASAVRPYWTPVNGVNDATGVYNTPVVHGGMYENRSFVRLQDISLAYQLNRKTLEYLKIQNARVYVASKNPYTYTKWSGWDPEWNTQQNDQNAARNMPVMRNVTVGLSLTL